MSIEKLQAAIREKKTPVALGLRPELEKVPQKVRRNFEEIYGPGPMTDAESIRFFSTRALDAAEGKLPAVVIHAASYLRRGMMGAEVLQHVVTAAKNKGFYVILGVGTGEPDAWWDYGADAVTVNPYLGGDVCAVPADKAAFALVRTGNPSAAEMQTLRAGDRPLFAAAAEQMARRGAGLVVGTGLSLDIQDIRRRNDKAFLLLPDCDGANAECAFDSYGHGAMTVDFSLAETGAVDEAIKEMKGWVTVL